LCRDDSDYDAMVKIMAVASLRKDVIIVIYIVVSNHFHAVILAESQAAADTFCEEVKKVFSMWFSHRYAERGVLRRVRSSAIWLDDNSYVRNALAYVPRNALDNGCNVDEYRWSGYSAMFRGGRACHSGAMSPAGSSPRPGMTSVTGLSPRPGLESFAGRSAGPDRPGDAAGSLSGYQMGQKGYVRGGSLRVRRVSDLKSREAERILHTGMDLSSVDWLLDDGESLVPSSFCDSAYLEQAFEGSQAYFLRMIGSVNVAEMDQKLVVAPRTRELDAEMLKEAEEMSLRWFGAGLSEISQERKLRLLPYIFRTRRTSASQLARVLGLSREVADRAVARIKGR